MKPTEDLQHDAGTTAVALLEPDDELQLLGDLAADPPATVLVVSDLHLGPGREPDTGRYRREDNFFADDAFASMLEQQTRPDDGPGLLVLNGDIFDFVRMSGTPKTDAELARWSSDLARLEHEKSESELRASIIGRERRFGLRTHDFKAVWKLAEVARGHDGFFTALAGWVDDGGTLLFVKGNHDLEIHWPLVRRMIRDQIAQRGAAPQHTTQRVMFCDDSIQLANVYLEHGHQYEKTTAVVEPATLPGRPQELSLPLGSFINRYLVNRFERIEPFLDNVKPVTTMLLELARRHPIRTVSIVWRSWRFILRATKMRRWKETLWFLVYLGALMVPVVTVLAIAAAVTWPLARTLISDVTGRVGLPLGVVGVLFPYLFGAIRDLLPGRRSKVGEDRYAAGVYERLEAQSATQPLKTRYAVLGHTHRQDVQRLPDLGDVPVLYINTGTWIPIWRQKRPELRGKIRHPLVRFSRRADGEYEHEYLEWSYTGQRLVTSVIVTGKRS